jgi:hypothetical protein
LPWLFGFLLTRLALVWLLQPWLLGLNWRAHPARRASFSISFIL